MNPDFRDILSEFSAEHVDFLVVGAYAMAAHGLVRATGDIDLWVRTDPENARRVLRALARVGALLSEVTERDFSVPDTVFQIGVVPGRIDVLTTISGVEFGDAWADRIEVEVEGVKVHVIGREHLVRNKRTTGRPKDGIDADWLEGTRD